MANTQNLTRGQRLVPPNLRQPRPAYGFLREAGVIKLLRQSGRSLLRMLTAVPTNSLPA